MFDKLNTPITVPSMLGVLLKLYREHMGLSLRQMAKRIGVDHCTLFNLENGKPVGLPTYWRILDWIHTGK